MKYTSEILIKIPIKDFIDKLDNYDNLKHWQRGLDSIEHLSGDPGTTGAKMRLNYTFGKRKMTLTETIIHADFPRELHLSFDTKGMHNVQENFFESTPEDFTKWISKNEFVPTNFVMRMMTLIMPKAFKKESMKYLKDFKNFAEKGISVDRCVN